MRKSTTPLQIGVLVVYFRTVIGVLIFLVLAATALDVFQRMKKKQSAKEGNDKLTFIGMHPIHSISAYGVAINGNGLTHENGLPPKIDEHLENDLPPKVDLSRDTTLPIENGGHTGAPMQHQDLHQSRISQLELVGKDAALGTTIIAAKSPGVSEGKESLHVYHIPNLHKVHQNV